MRAERCRLIATIVPILFMVMAPSPASMTLCLRTGDDMPFAQRIMKARLVIVADGGSFPWRGDQPETDDRHCFMTDMSLSMGIIGA